MSEDKTAAQEILKWCVNVVPSGSIYFENINGDLYLIGEKHKHVTVGQLKALAQTVLSIKKGKHE